jgi:hypothetical protein
MYGIMLKPTQLAWLLACRLKIIFSANLKLIISILVQLQHLLLPSLIVTSSQVRVGTPLPLPSCCIPGLGPKGLWHNCTIPINLPGIFLLRVNLASGETLPPRTFHAKLHGQSAVSTRCPTMLQHPLEKQVTSSCTYKDQNFLGVHKWRVSPETRLNPVLAPTSFFRGSHMQEQYHQWTTLHTWSPNSRSKIWCPSGLTLRCMPYGRGTLRIPLQRIL